MQSFAEKPKNMEYAHKLFRELNKHEMYLTVIRLYWKHELDKEYKMSSK